MLVFVANVGNDAYHSDAYYGADLESRRRRGDTMPWQVGRRQQVMSLVQEPQRLPYAYGKR